MRGTEGTSETGSETADKAPTPAEPCTITGNSLSPGDDGWMDGRKDGACVFKMWPHTPPAVISCYFVGFCCSNQG